MPQPLAGAGQGLQLSQSLYPAGLLNGQTGGSTNDFSLAPGDAIPVQAGRFVITLGKYCSLQYNDPVTGAWTIIRDLDNNASTHNVWSDGYNLRIANLTGCVVGAVVTNGGSGGYVQSTTTVTPSTGTSTWQPIVGGAVNTTVSITSIVGVAFGGKNYTIAPLVFFDAPPTPGVPATGVAVISGGSVTSITVTNQGAGYLTAPTISIYPSPYDPNFTTGTTQIINAQALCSLTGAGSITACILLNSGAPVANTMTLTVAGAGTTATAVPLFLQTLTSAATTTVVSGGGGYGTFTQLTTVGGFNNNTPAFTSPQVSMTGFLPRPAAATFALTGTAITSVANLVDAGLFMSSPSPVPVTNGIVTTVASITVLLGSQSDTVRIQQLA